MWFESGWVRAVISAIPLLREWLQAEAKPEPIETAFVQGGTAFLEIENRGETADFTAQIVKAVNVEQWPGKTVWARWDHDKDAKSMKIPQRTKARIRVARWMDRPDGDKWVCFWGSDYAMGQQSVARVGGPDWMAEIHIQIVSDPDCLGGPYIQIVFLKTNGMVSCLPKTMP
jgi:hypothetical protein